jgi:lipopolysaccharide/colanic/teichoic acid biosynthesis glycosyltransferase
MGLHVDSSNLATTLRGDTSIAKHVEYDLYYLRNWSLTFDLQIMTMTVLRIFNSKNAY